MKYGSLISSTWRAVNKASTISSSINVNVDSRILDYRLCTRRMFMSKSETVQDFVSSMTPYERTALLNELNRRLTKKSDQAGSTQQAPSTTTSTVIIESPPSMQQLRLIFIHQALPFIGFGFLDNFIMIVAGDYIDSTIGLTLGISTMAAAGLGNAISDVAGIGSAWYVEKLAASVGIEFPKISETQSDMPRTRWSIHLGRGFGVAIGCLLGMFPLLFLPTKEDLKEKKDSK